MMSSTSLSGTYISAPDTPSPVYPDRLIRPLPKRPLRSRLSQEAADSILFPPAPATTTPLFYHSYGENGEFVNDAKVHVQQNVNSFHDAHDHHDHDHHHYEDEGIDSSDEEGPVVVRRSTGYPFQGALVSKTGAASGHRQSVHSHGRGGDVAASKVMSSSSDGYDAFENTNNKKKRKIPTSGTLGNHHSSLSAELANMGLDGQRDVGPASPDEGGGVGQYYGSGNPAAPASTGISGAGRGRYGRNGGRSVSGRSPLGVSINGSNAWMAGRNGGSRSAIPTSTSTPPLKGNITDQGIISTAIANAAALSTAPQKGQENVSLLEQQSKKSTPTNTQFTFTCESDSSKGMAWQQNHFSTPPQRSGNHNVANSAHGLRFATQGTQTSPNMAGQTGQQGQNGAQATGGQQNPPGKKPPRRPGNLYALSARQRRLQQEYSNLHHPPNLDEIWICEFCEYESIFGHPPEALIRQYEIKDRKERRRLAEKRRLLEKAKLKGRKGKKATKNAAKAAQAAAAAAQQPPHQPKYDPQAADQGGMLNHGTQSEEYLEDEYDDEPIPMPAPPPQTPLKQPSMSQQMKSAYQARQVAANGIGKQRGGGVTGREP